MPAGKLEPLSQAPAPWRFAGAIALVWGAALLRAPLHAAAANAVYLTVYPAVMLASLVLGKGPGIVGALFGLLVVERMMPGELLAPERLIRVAVVLFAAALVGRVAEKVREAQGKLQRATERKNEFIAVLSHELRNPLAAMRNALHILEGGHPAAQVERSREILERQVQHLSRLVDDLLDVARISRGIVQLQRTRIDLQDVTARCIEDHRGIAAEHGITLTSAGEADAVPVDADPTRIAQVIGNLVANGIKFTDPGGRVDVSLSRNDGQALLSVRDTGVGIAPELIGQVFEPFTQGDKSLHRTRGGLGLGLSLVKALVELHGGTVQVRSDGVGRGTEIVVTLPIAPGPVLTPSVPAAAVPRSARRILIVEDNADAADTLHEILRRRGHTVEVARDGERGIERALTFRPDVVLCDIGLPGIDGYGVARAIRSDPTLAGTYLVALTGYALPDDQRRAHEAGFDRHIAKPVMPGDIEEAIASVGSPEAA